MKVFLFILTNNIIPIFVLIALGFLISRKFELNINTLSKLIFYIFSPCFIFVNLYKTSVPLEMMKVMAIAVMILGANMLIAALLSKVRGYSEGLKNAFANSIMFYNSANIGIPLITLVFSSEPFIVNGETPYLSIALTVQIMVLVVQNISTHTIGLINAGKADTQWKDSFIKAMKMPIIYAILLAFACKALPYDLTNLPVWSSLNYAGDALVPVSLITLGIQLMRTPIELRNIDVYLSCFVRLLVGPVLAVIFIYMLRVDGIIAHTLVISSAVPSSVNSALIAVEYDNHPDFASQVVVASTLLSAVSLAFVIYMARLLFPVA
ncbi:AEC family transporter [Lutispora sp.]|uniref:AEC family transporter n=1 Tax=Lutispora sp. TaxID=2828727 RepID=UPI000EE054DE|nr:AEC family transporter [Lutispora sp.]MEA4961787.1 AEC family transporter [Lutispora sp.]HCJ57591.1 transporter [Clostridiaceae bacterium]